MICNQPLTTTDALGRVTNYTYIATHGGIESVLAPAPAAGQARQRITYAYSQIAAVSGSVWRPVSVTTCATAETCTGTTNEARTTIAYATGKALPVSTTSGNGSGSLSTTTSFGYTTLGDVATVNGPLSGTTDQSYFFYDILRRQFGVIGPDPDVSGSLLRRALRTTFTTRGLSDVVTQGTVTGTSLTALNAIIGLQQQDTDYDGFGRPITARNLVAGATQGLVQLNYDASSRPLCTALRVNASLFSGALPYACTLGAASPTFGDNRVTQTNYDVFDRPVSVVTASGTAVAITDAVTTYTLNGQTATVADGKGNKTTYEYDGFDRLKKTRFPSPTSVGASSTSDFEELFYDAGSRTLSRRLRDAQIIAYAYDSRDRLTGVDIPGGTADDIANAYDVMGRVTASGIPGQNQTFVWDMLGRMTSATSPIGSANKKVSYQYDLANRRTRVTFPSDTGATALYASYSYLVTGEMTEVRENSASTGTNVLARYAYDNLGRRVSLQRGGGTAMTTSYAYAANDNRLSQISHNLSGTANDQTFTFGWSPSEQIASRTASNNAYSWTDHFNEDLLATLNGLNQVTQVGATTLNHDARGNLTSDGANIFAYDAQNRLTAATAGGATATLKYDALGRLYETAKSGAVTRFLYDGAEAIAEYSGTGTLLRRYVRGPGADEALVWVEGLALTDKRFLLTDERGSVIGAANASGASLFRNTYDDYGRPGAANQGRFQYTGQMWLAEAGLYHYKARAYSPFLGRFLQTDPIGYADGLNLYAYVGGDPVNNIDPSGLLDEIIVTGIRPQADGGGGGGFGGFSGFSGGGNGGEGGGGGRDTSLDDEIVVTGTRTRVTLVSVPIFGGATLNAFGHENESDVLVCADGSGISDQQLADSFNSFIVPRLFPGPVSNNSLNLVTDPRFGLPGGFVRTTLSGQFSGTNTTTPLHVLYNGTVTSRP